MDKSKNTQYIFAIIITVITISLLGIFLVNKYGEVKNNNQKKYELEYKVNLNKIQESKKELILDAVKNTIEKRIQGLGISEYKLSYNKNQNIIVELTTVKNIEEARATVGKTIQLEFKEKKDSLDPGGKEAQTKYANNILANIRAANANFNIIGQEEEENNPGRVTYTKDDSLVFISDLPSSLQSAVKNLQPNEVNKDLVASNEEYIIDDSGQAQKTEGIYIIKLLEKAQAVKNTKEVFVEHILISYKEAANKAGIPNVTRSEADALKLTKNLKNQIRTQADFERLAKENTDDEGSQNDGGKLSQPVTADAGYVQEFKDAALKLNTAGEMSDIVKTEFGYHLIRALDVKSDVKEDQVKLQKIFVSTMPDPWKSTELTGEHFVHADVQVSQTGEPYVSIQFDDTGTRIFEEITSRNINKPIAIFVGGTLISAPNVSEKISGGQAQISGNFTFDNANDLARDLNTGAIPAPITFIGFKILE